MYSKKYHRVCFAILLLASLFGCDNNTETSNSEALKPVDQALVANNPALAMVVRFNIGSNLESMAIQVSKTTNAYAMVSEKHGAANAESAIRQEIKRILPSYQPRWNQILASVYSSYFSPDELRSLAVDGKTSPYASRLQNEQKSVGKDMQKVSSPILIELVTKALTNAVN